MRNGTEGAVRLFHAARTNEGRLYAMAILYCLDPETFRSETMAVMQGEVRFHRDGKDWTERAEEIRRHPERLEKPRSPNCFLRKDDRLNPFSSLPLPG